MVRQPYGMVFHFLYSMENTSICQAYEVLVQWLFSVAHRVVPSACTGAARPITLVFLDGGAVCVCWDGEDPGLKNF